MGRSTSPEETRDRIRECLRELQDSGTTYVKSKRIAQRLDLRKQRVGANMGVLANEGVVEAWGSDTGGTAWKITLDEDGGRDA